MEKDTLAQTPRISSKRPHGLRVSNGRKRVRVGVEANFLAFYLNLNLRPLSKHLGFRQRHRPRFIRSCGCIGPIFEIKKINCSASGSAAHHRISLAPSAESFLPQSVQVFLAESDAFSDLDSTIHQAL